ncbi:MAG: glycosyl hydrolase family 28 protein [Thermoguttaceae bacterium]|nr:glycosyl hydrolase family 28 protein [Thermoguttaceae bacterium]
MMKFQAGLLSCLFVLSGLVGMVQAQVPENLDAWLIESIHTQQKKNKKWLFFVDVPANYSPDFKLAVNGKQANVVKFHEVSYANLSPDKTFELVLSANVAITDVQVSPKSRNLVGRIKDGAFHLRLDRPEKLILTCNGQYRFFVFANPEGAGLAPRENRVIVNAGDFGIDSTGKSDSTAGIQKAIDEASKVKGIAWIPKGTYRVLPLHMRSDTTVYLEQETVLKLTDDEKLLTPFIEKWRAETGRACGFFDFDQVKNVRVCGLGTIDCNSTQLNRIKFQYRWKFCVVYSMDSENLEIRDCILKDPPNWNTHLTNSKHIILDNVKVINNINVNNTDGIDPDNCANVTVNNSFVYSSDDCVVIKTLYHKTPKNAKRLPFVNAVDFRITNNVFWTRANAMKIGTETYRDMKNICFKNNDIVHTAIGCTIEIRNGGQMTNLQFIDNRIESLGDICGSRIFNMVVRKWIYNYQKATTVELPSFGSITNLTIKNLQVAEAGKMKSVLGGLNETSFIKNVVFDNFTVGSKKIMKAQDLPFTVGEYVDGLEFK